MLTQNNKFGNLFMMFPVTFEILIPHSVRITHTQVTLISVNSKKLCSEWILANPLLISLFCFCESSLGIGSIINAILKIHLLPYTTKGISYNGRTFPQLSGNGNCHRHYCNGFSLKHVCNELTLIDPIVILFPFDVKYQWFAEVLNWRNRNNNVVIYPWKPFLFIKEGNDQITLLTNELNLSRRHKLRQSIGHDFVFISSEAMWYKIRQYVLWWWGYLVFLM